ncbi:MAG: hypothetical protein J6K26_01405 [Lachnospiraceae bacterium]|nr:hypothetical protein [Lachnospiraceae bacterium]
MKKFDLRAIMEAAWKQLGYEVIHGSKALFGAELIWGSRGDGAIYKARFFGRSVNGRVALLKELKTAAGVTDVRKVYSIGTTDSVMEKYQDYISGGDTPWEK